MEYPMRTPGKRQRSGDMTWMMMKTYNPESKWDWYSEGGRWGAWLILKEKDENGVPLTAIFATKSEVDWDRMFPNRVPFCHRRW